MTLRNINTPNFQFRWNRRAFADFERFIDSQVETIARETSSLAKSRAPIDEGGLRAALRYYRGTKDPPERHTWIVEAVLPGHYITFVELGAPRIGIKRQPFLRLSMIQAGRAIARRMGGRFGKGRIR